MCGHVWQCSAMRWVPADLVGSRVTAGLRLVQVPILHHHSAGVFRESLRTPKTCCISVPERFLTFPINVPVPPHRLGIAFAYYGVILASAELLERDLSCGSTAPLGEDPGPISEESRSPCHCHPFGPSAYRTMIISTAGEIACNLLFLPRPSRPSLPPAGAHCAVLLAEHPEMSCRVKCPRPCWRVPGTSSSQWGDRAMCHGGRLQGLGTGRPLQDLHIL